jgi:glycerophosphoryl diester phosphodiesterase
MKLIREKGGFSLMKIKQLKIINQDESTEIADIGADAVNIDYNNTTVKAELDKLNTSDSLLINTQNSLQSKVNSLQSEVNSIVGGTPKVVTSTSQMTDTNKIYVLSTNGKWYYHNGTSWVAGGTYQPAATTLDNIRNEIPLSTNTHNMFIKEIFLQGFDPTKSLELRSIRKAWYDSAGDKRYHTDFTLKYSDDPTNATITGFGYTKNTEALSLKDCEIQIYKLNPSNNSGVTGYVVIDYSQLETGSRILNPSAHIVLNPNKYKFLPNNPSIENYITNQKLDDYLPYIRQKFTNIYSFGHQGFGAGQNGYRGNSLTGFKKGAIFGFDSLECDIKVTSDNQLVLNHDPTITDDDGVTYTIAETTLAELRAHLYGGETICTLEECLNVCKIFGVNLSIDHVYTLLNNDEAYNRMKSLVYLYSMQEKIFIATLQMWRGGDIPPFHQKLCQDFPKATLIFKNEDSTWTNAKFDIVKEDYIDTYGMKVFVGGPYATSYSIENIRVAQQYPDIKIGFYTIDDLNQFYNISKHVDWITSDRFTGRNVVLLSGVLN